MVGLQRLRYQSAYHLAIDDTEVLTLDGGALGVAASSIARVSFMRLMRLATDEVEIEHITDADGVASTAVTWRGLRDDLEAL